MSSHRRPNCHNMEWITDSVGSLLAASAPPFPKAQRLSLNPDISTTSASTATRQECGTWSSVDPTPLLRDRIHKLSR